jgi:DNA-binding NarL/FixJ family response regulator
MSLFLMLLIMIAMPSRVLIDRRPSGCGARRIQAPGRRGHDRHTSGIVLPAARRPGDEREGTRQIKTALPDTHTLTLTMHSDDTYVFQVLKARASGYVLKRAASTDLVQAIRAAVGDRRRAGPGQPPAERGGIREWLGHHGQQWGGKRRIEMELGG